jgi:hypothetical protein
VWLEMSDDASALMLREHGPPRGSTSASRRSRRMYTTPVERRLELLKSPSHAYKTRSREGLGDQASGARAGADLLPGRPGPPRERAGSLRLPYGAEPLKTASAAASSDYARRRSPGMTISAGKRRDHASSQRAPIAARPSADRVKSPETTSGLGGERLSPWQVALRTAAGRAASRRCRSRPRACPPSRCRGARGVGVRARPASARTSPR